jgi:hypothetical protein
MRRSTLAVFLLLMSPVPVRACDGHAGVAPEWFAERPRSAWELAQGRGEEMRWDELLGAAGLAAGSGAMLLVAVSLRAASRGRKPRREPAAPTPLAVPFDRPAGLPVRVDPGHEGPGPRRFTREDAGEPWPVAVAVAGR